MKLVMDEKLKHRLVGLAVIISLGAVFAPAIMKKSNQKLEGSFSVNIKLPPKPSAPDVIVTREKDLFKTIKITRVDIPRVSSETQLPKLVHAEFLSKSTHSTKEKIASVQGASNNAAIASVKQNRLSPALLLSKSKASAAVNTAKHSISKQNTYTLQLASFTSKEAAQILVDRLKSKGYKATYSKTTGKNGPMYKVCSGQSSNRAELLKLKDLLASTMRLNGLIVATGVS